MLKTNTNQKGFTIVELLIVIVVIGILAMLVLNTFNGVQQKARNTERQTDATSVAKQLEAYFAEKGGYPLWSQWGSTPTSGSTLLKGTSENAYTAPATTAGTFSWQNSATTDKDHYGYVPSGCTTSNDSCTSFVITYFTEGQTGTPAATQVKSLN